MHPDLGAAAPRLKKPVGAGTPTKSNLNSRFLIAETTAAFDRQILADPLVITTNSLLETLSCSVTKHFAVDLTTDDRHIIARNYSAARGGIHEWKTRVENDTPNTE